MKKSKLRVLAYIFFALQALSIIGGSFRMTFERIQDNNEGIATILGSILGLFIFLIIGLILLKVATKREKMKI